MHFWQRFNVTVTANIYLRLFSHCQCVMPHVIFLSNSLVVIHLKKETCFSNAVLCCVVLCCVVLCCVVTVDEGLPNISVYITDK
jgi:hypothetical protein